MKRALALAAVTLIVAIGVWATRRPPEPAPAPMPAPTGKVAAPVQRARLPAPPVAPSRLLGVNEGLSVPSRGPFDRIGASATLARRTTMLRDLGAGLVRVNSHGWPGTNHLEWKGPADLDRAVKAAESAGVDLVVVIGPWPGARTAAFTSRYVPDDLPAYAAWVTSVVERYDGDGADDVPGLARPVRIWEVDNEPDLHNSVAPKGPDVAEDFDPTAYQTPAEYARVLVATSAAIRDADPGATVLSGGLFKPASGPGRAYLESALSEPGAHAAIDGLSLHCYFAEDSLNAVARTMETARSVAPGLPVWITETSVPSEPGAEHVDELFQARLVVGIVSAFLAEGARAVLWHTLSDTQGAGESIEPRGFASNSLFRALRAKETTVEPKPSALAFSRLAHRLAGLESADVAEVPADGGRLLETPGGWIAFWGEPAVPPGGGTVTDLLTGETASPGERVVAPAFVARR